MDGEFYEREGRRYHRPTHVLDYFAPPELVDWKIKTGRAEARRISRIALKHGSRVDELVRTGDAVTSKDDPEVRNCLKAFYKWKSDYGVGELVFPATHYCEIRGIAGTPDVYWEKAQDLIDVKSSKRIHESYLFQVGGCYASLVPFPVKRVAILRLDKELGDYEYVTNEKLGLSLEELKHGFNGLLDYYKAYKRVQSALKPKEKVYDGTSGE